MDGLNVEANRNRLLRAQRSALIAVCCAYRTVATVALQVIGAAPPIDLLAKERAHNHGADSASKAYNRRCLIERWQERWDNATEGSWTRKLIPDIDRWIKRSHGHTNYYLTQALSGHGSFATYTKRIGKTDDDRCMYCGLVDTADHTISQREAAYTALGGVINRDNMISSMLENEANWEAINRMCCSIMRAKGEDERMRE